ncbi:Uncharacterized protein HZ326_19667, partial [Fusarium oxysporum f. sp. albedinis]
MSQDGMFPQFLSMEYGSQRRLEQKLDEHLGNGNYEVVQRLGSQWKVMVKEELNEVWLLFNQAKQPFSFTWLY